MYRFAVHDPAFLPHSACRVDLAVAAGQLLSLVGENGVGKTTLLRRIFRDHPLTVGLVPQIGLDHFFDRPLGKVRRIYLAAGGPAARFEALWEAFNLHRKEERFLSGLSGGEAQALKLCLGLAAEKAVYLLDEPHQHLDPEARRRLSEILRGLTAAGRGVVLVEHNLELVPKPSTVLELVQRDGALVVGGTWTI
jgi:ABC-type multidrug transport system ATPase subunit